MPRPLPSADGDRITGPADDGDASAAAARATRAEVIAALERLRTAIRSTQDVLEEFGARLQGDLDAPAGLPGSGEAERHP